jgi:hypothetical protein
MPESGTYGSVALPSSRALETASLLANCAIVDRSKVDHLETIIASGARSLPLVRCRIGGTAGGLLDVALFLTSVRSHHLN